jgi:hypothetical protein
VYSFLFVGKKVRAAQLAAASTLRFLFSFGSSICKDLTKCLFLPKFLEERNSLYEV